MNNPYHNRRLSYSQIRTIVKMAKEWVQDEKDNSLVEITDFNRLNRLLGLPYKRDSIKKLNKYINGREIELPILCNIYYLSTGEMTWVSPSGKTKITKHIIAGKKLRQVILRPTNGKYRDKSSLKTENKLKVDLINKQGWTVYGVYRGHFDIYPIMA